MYNFEYPNTISIFVFRFSIFGLSLFFHVNPSKPSFLSVGRRQTVETQIRHCRMRCLTRVSTVCLQKKLWEIEYKLTPLKFEIDSSYR